MSRLDLVHAGVVDDQDTELGEGVVEVAAALVRQPATGSAGADQLRAHGRKRRSDLRDDLDAGQSAAADRYRRAGAGQTGNARPGQPGVQVDRGRGADQGDAVFGAARYRGDVDVAAQRVDQRVVD